MSLSGISRCGLDNAGAELASMTGAPWGEGLSKETWAALKKPNAEASGRVVRIAPSKESIASLLDQMRQYGKNPRCASCFGPDVVILGVFYPAAHEAPLFEAVFSPRKPSEVVGGVFGLCSSCSETPDAETERRVGNTMMAVAAQKHRKAALHGEFGGNGMSRRNTKRDIEL